MKQPKIVLKNETLSILTASLSSSNPLKHTYFKIKITFFDAWHWIFIYFIWSIRIASLISVKFSLWIWPMISHPIIQCNPQSHFDYKTSDLSLQIRKKTSWYLKANLDRRSFKMSSSVSDMVTHNFTPKLEPYKIKTSNPLNLVLFLKKMFNHLKFFHILIWFCNPHNHSLFFICLWLGKNVTKPPLFLTMIAL